MDKTFNELFDDFFKRNNIKPDDYLHESLRDEAKRMIEMLTNFRDIDEDIEKEMDASLGEPDQIERFTENGMYIERRVWHTPTGDLIKLIASDRPLESTGLKYCVPISEKSLQEKLDEALASEKYEEAAKLRDELKKINEEKEKEIK